MAAQIQDLETLGWYHTIEFPDGRIAKGLQSVDQLRARIAQFDLPANLSGKRVLDIGAWDGWFSFEMERRGAEVVAIDRAANTRFLVAKRELGSNVDHRVLDLLDASPDNLGTFDIVLFFGVLYHSKHPLLALERACALSRDVVCVESFVSDVEPAKPAMEFYETRELRGQFDNWFGPNVPCLLAMCRAVGFAGVHLRSVIEQRAHVQCQRLWPALFGDVGPKPHLLCVENAEYLNQDFSTHRDDYLSLWFEAEAEALTPDQVRVQAGEFGVRPVHVEANATNGWRAIAKLPLGLRAGFSLVSVSGGGGWSNAVHIPIDVPRDWRQSDPGQFPILGVTDGRTYESNRIRAGMGSCVSVWIAEFSTIPERHSASIRMNACSFPASFVSMPDQRGVVQVNALLPSGMEPGTYYCSVWLGESASEQVLVQIVTD